MGDKRVDGLRLQIQKIISLYLEDSGEYNEFNIKINQYKSNRNRINLLELIHDSDSDLADLIHVYNQLPKEFFDELLDKEHKAYK